MKKSVLFAIIFIIFMLLPCRITASAEEMPSAEELGIDMEGLGENLPESAEEYMEENGFSVSDTESMTSVSPKDIFGYIVKQFKDKIQYPLTVFLMLAGVIILGSVIDGMSDSISNRSLENVYSLICVLAAAGIIAEPISMCIDSAADTLYSGGDFMIGYIPVFAGITASSGGVTSAVSYTTIVLLVAEAAVQLASGYIMPVVSICMAMGIIESVNPAFNLTSITEAVTKAVKFALGFIMTVFIGLLSIQSIIGASADTIGVKAAKYLASNCIPVVGGAVADAYTTLKASLGILRGGAGFFGIAVIFLTVVPPLVEITAMRLAFAGAEILGDIFGVSRIKTLMKNSSSILSLIFSLLVCFAVMLIISTTLLMMVGLNIS